MKIEDLPIESNKKGKSVIDLVNKTENINPDIVSESEEFIREKLIEENKAEARKSGF